MTAAQKSTEAFRTISEAANELDVPQHVLRFWETKFSQIKPMKRGGGRRYYRPADIDLLKGIRKLLYEDGFTIKGVQKVLRERGVRFVMDAGTLSAQAQTVAAEIAAPSLAAQEVPVIAEVSEAVQQQPTPAEPAEAATAAATDETREPQQDETPVDAPVDAEASPRETPEIAASAQSASIPVPAAPPVTAPIAATKVAPSVSKQLDMAVAAVMQGAGTSPIKPPPTEKLSELAAERAPETAQIIEPAAGEAASEIADASTPADQQPVLEQAAQPEPAEPDTSEAAAPRSDPGTGALKPSFAAAQGFVLSSITQPTATDVQFSPDQSITFKSIATPDNDDTAERPIIELAKDGVTDDQRRQLEDILIKLEGLKDEIDRTMASLAADDGTSDSPDAAQRAQWQSRASNENREGEAGTEVSNSGERKAEAG